MKKFTLIELLIVVAIIGILVSILLPSLMKARKKAESAVCKSNLKQLSITLTIYSHDNKDNMVVGWTGYNWNCVTWDDYIGDYMDRPLTLAQKKKEWISKADSNSNANQIFKCPSDSIPLDPAFPNGWRRSYVINKNTNSNLGVAWRNSNIKVDEIANDTMVLTERPHARNRLGKEGYSLMYDADTLGGSAQDHHGKGMFNFLRMDSSASTMHFSAKIGGGNLTAPQGMWTLSLIHI